MSSSRHGLCLHLIICAKCIFPAVGSRGRQNILYSKTKGVAKCQE